MKRAAVLVSALAMVVYTVGLSAQAKPNFAGKWTLEPDAAAAAAGGGGGRGGRGGGRGAFGGMELTVTQDASTITVERMQGQNAVKYTYKLDGSESKNTVMGRGGQSMEQSAKAAWDGAKLKITTAGQNGDTVQVLSMDGGMLVVETTAPGFQGGAPTTTTTKYKKG